MATAILGGAASGRRIGLRRSLRLSRAVFWQVVWAAFLVGIVSQVVTYATAAVIGRSTGDSELATIVEVAASGLATMPFGFYQAGIILGGVGACEAIRRSTRIARARWRLALLVARDRDRPRLHRGLRARRGPRPRAPLRRRGRPGLQRQRARRRRCRS